MQAARGDQRSFRPAVSIDDPHRPRHNDRPRHHGCREHEADFPSIEAFRLEPHRQERHLNAGKRKDRRIMHRHAQSKAVIARAWSAKSHGMDCALCVAALVASCRGHEQRDAGDREEAE
jgi:hypothetical protein